MTHKRAQRRLYFRLAGGMVAVVLILGFASFVHTMMLSKTNKPERLVQTVRMIRLPPPPPPPDQPPPPPPEKTEEQLPKDKPEPVPNDEPPPAEQLGLDAEGSAGSDPFGLAARRGGSDLIGGNGTAMFAWYTNRLKDAVLDKLTAASCGRGFSASARFWIEPDGRIKEVKMVTTTGNQKTDKCIQGALSSPIRLSDAPPLEMPQPVSLRIVSRG
jgi:protein TonB